MLEIKALIPGPSAALKIETMVNLRGRLAAKDPRLADSLHLFAAPIDMVSSVAEEEAAAGLDRGKERQQQQQQGMWARARAFKTDLNMAMAGGQWRHQVAAFHSFKRGGGLVYRMLERLAVGPSQGRVKAAAVSNLGSLDAKLAGAQSSSSSWAVSRLQWGITEHVRSLLFVPSLTTRPFHSSPSTTPMCIIAGHRPVVLRGGLLAARHP